MAVLRTFLYLLVYPGLLFLFAYSTFCEWFDRKAYARLQNRMGPTHTGRFGLLQPVADFFKLMAKEDIVPAAADQCGREMTPGCVVVFAIRAPPRPHGIRPR